MILGSHNTMTYRNPKKWYLWPFKWMARCQSVDYRVQHETYGVNCFDLRLFWDTSGVIEFRHGGFAYDASDLDDILKYAEDNGIICRILFEERDLPKSLITRSLKMNLKQKFIDTCTRINEKYPGLKCYCGRNCGSWEKLMTDWEDLPEIGLYSSVTSLFTSDNPVLKKIDDWFPWFYARIMNRQNRKNVEEQKDNIPEDTIVQFDFIEIQ